MSDDNDLRSSADNIRLRGLKCGCRVSSVSPHLYRTRHRRRARVRQSSTVMLLVSWRDIIVNACRVRRAGRGKF